MAFRVRELIGQNQSAHNTVGKLAVLPRLNQVEMTVTAWVASERARRHALLFGLEPSPRRPIAVSPLHRPVVTAPVVPPQSSKLFPPRAGVGLAWEGRVAPQGSASGNCREGVRGPDRKRRSNKRYIL